MGKVKPWTLYANEIAQKIQKLQDTEIYPLANKWKKDFPHWDAGNDVRVHWFIGLARVLNNFKLSYIVISQMGNSVWWRTILKGNPDPRLIDSDIKDWIREFETSIIWAYVHGIWSITEESLRLLSKAMGGSEVGNIKNVCGHLLKLLDLQNYETLFDLCRLVRNTTHNNGIHMPENLKDVSLNWKGVQYNFRTGQGINFASSDFLITIFGLNLGEAMNQIMSVQQIQRLSSVPRRINLPPSS